MNVGAKQGIFDRSDQHVGGGVPVGQPHRCDPHGPAVSKGPIEKL